MFAFVWFMLWAYASLVGSSDQNDGLNYSLVKSIFLLAGQSNMSGRGGVINNTWDGVIPPQYRANSSILRLSAGLTWVKAKDPLHKDIDVNVTCGVGPGMAFAKSVLEKDPSLGVIGLVPCAVGGTRISQWDRGSFLYNQMMRRAQAAVQGGGTIRALLWYQGESDTVTHELAEQYKMRLERFFTSVRSDLRLPALPIIQVLIASGQGPYVEKVREAQKGIQLPNFKSIDAMGLPLEPDNLHLSTPAQVELGRMYADSFLQSSSLPAQAPTQSSGGTRLQNFVFDTLFRGLLFR